METSLDQRAPEQPAQFTLDELIALDGFRDADPSKIFGVDFDHTPEDKLHPAAQTYANIGMALEGAPLDDWARHGMYISNRRPEFSSFDAVTQGLDAEGKRRFCVILLQYLSDLYKRAPDFKNKHFEMETLSHAIGWVSDMLGSADENSFSSARGVEKWRRIIPDRPLRRAVQPAVHSTRPANPESADIKTLGEKVRGWFAAFRKTRP